MPAGFTEHKNAVGSLGLNHVIGGHGPAVVLLHSFATVPMGAGAR